MYWDNSIIAAYWSRSKAVKANWGDKLTPVLIHGLTGLPVAHVDDILGWQDRQVFRIIGSGLSTIKPNQVVWGMGFIDGTTSAPNNPGPIYAVRGPKSRRRLLEAGIGCPEVYGDPAILYPLIYWPKIEVSHEFGVIQHCREVDVIPPPKVSSGKSVINIDVRSDINKFVDQILSCRVIISSSLHGIICAHSYGIPAFWVKASDLPVGDDFKFYDYFSSLGISDLMPIVTDPQGYCVIPSDLKDNNFSLINVDKLIDVCPFMSAKQKRHWQRKRRNMIRDGAKGTIFF